MPYGNAPDSVARGRSGGARTRDRGSEATSGGTDSYSDPAFLLSEWTAHRLQPGRSPSGGRGGISLRGHLHVGHEHHAGGTLPNSPVSVRRCFGLPLRSRADGRAPYVRQGRKIRKVQLGEALRI